MALKAFGANDYKVIGSSRNKANKIIVNLSKNTKSRNLTYVPNIGAIVKSFFLIFNIKKTFYYLRQMFIKALIL